MLLQGTRAVLTSSNADNGTHAGTFYLNGNWTASDSNANVSALTSRLVSSLNKYIRVSSPLGEKFRFLKNNYAIIKAEKVISKIASYFSWIRHCDCWNLFVHYVNIYLIDVFKVYNLNQKYKLGVSYAN